MDTFGRQAPDVFVRIVGNDPAIGSHHSPPRQVVDSLQDPTNRPSRTRVARLRGDIAVAQDITWNRRGENCHDSRLKGSEAADAHERATHQASRRASISL